MRCVFANTCNCVCDVCYPLKNKPVTIPSEHCNRHGLGCHRRCKS